MPGSNLKMSDREVSIQLFCLWIEIKKTPLNALLSKQLSKYPGECRDICYFSTIAN